MSRHSVVGLHLDAAVVTHVLHPRQQARREEFGRSIDASGIDFLVLGGDRVDAGESSHTAIDATVAATVLARHTSAVGLVVAGGVVRDHPFNLARRLGSLDHGSRGRAGWLVETPDRPAGSWATADPVDIAVDAVSVVRKLWESWPGDSIVDDAERGIFADSERIVHIDHSGIFSVSGPLNVPEPPQRKPPVFWRPATAAEQVAARRTADTVILPDEESVRPYRAHFDADAARDQVVLIDRQRTHGSAPPATGADGVIIRGFTAPDLPAVLDAVRREPNLHDPRRTLRDRLGLQAAETVLSGGRSAFPVS
ncbi:LLM class flavin-dependent oxidoreductase [Rhodococcus sp. NCIMB 12038]|uniref:LLM class flavin-dependent oxidoreductase n=1 Tax=Rhodococcus sp. NCIMB 12038 TaxID=933800 RepID=UPI000B3CC868|nr:LLM class flavin-dependent oxidoreductase [Rhodococcus sp. NCIMB 12038]OUS94652.1 nitrilotriacetate monooxygenase [Rhodococcus sp. NCIMB 12038]